MELRTPLLQGVMSSEEGGSTMSFLELRVQPNVYSRVEAFSLVAGGTSMKGSILAA